MASTTWARSSGNTLTTTATTASFNSSGTYTTLNDPLGTKGTQAYGINDAGQIVGDYIDSNGTEHGFLYSGGTYTTIDRPRATNGTEALGINDAGQIAGYYVDSSSAVHGFLYSGGTYTTFDVSPGFSILAGINNAGQLVGSYPDRNSPEHGFLATPPTATTYTFSTLNAPAGGIAALTYASGINDWGRSSEATITATWGMASAMAEASTLL